MLAWHVVVVLFFVYISLHLCFIDYSIWGLLVYWSVILFQCLICCSLNIFWLWIYNFGFLRGFCGFRRYFNFIMPPLFSRLLSLGISLWNSADSTSELLLHLCRLLLFWLTGFSLDLGSGGTPWHMEHFSLAIRYWVCCMLDVWILVFFLGTLTFLWEDRYALCLPNQFDLCWGSWTSGLW